MALIALAPLLLALPGARPGRSLWLGYLTGVLWGIGTLYWTALVVVQYGGLSLPVGIGVTMLICLAVAVFPALFAWMVARWSVVDPRGRVLTRTELFERTAIVEDVTLLAGDTFRSRHGDVFAWTCFAGAAIAIAATFHRRTWKATEVAIRVLAMTLLERLPRARMIGREMAQAFARSPSKAALFACRAPGSASHRICRSLETAGPRAHPPRGPLRGPSPAAASRVVF